MKSRRRITATQLARTLEAAGRPIYALDADCRLVYLSGKVGEWLGDVATDQLLGTTCRYHSEPQADALERIAAGLCPPPEVFAGRRLTGGVCRIRPNEPTIYRQANFIPLASDDRVHAVVVILGEDDLSQPLDIVHTTTGPEPSAVELHRRIRLFRMEKVSHAGSDWLIGTNPAIVKARAQVAMAIESRGNVLLSGPPGSGRRQAVEAIHYGIGRKAGPLLVVDCKTLAREGFRITVAMLTSELSQKELERGAMLLRDVDRVTLDLQAELMSVLLEANFPLRLFATSRGSLEPLVARGTFLEPLATALSTLVISLPTLASRLEDLPLLTQLLIERYNRTSERQLSGITPEALDALAHYSWPGSIAELADILLRACHAANDTHVQVQDLPPSIRLAEDAAHTMQRRDETIVLDDFLADIEKELLARAMRKAKGNKAQAARLLGLTRPRLYRRLELLGLQEREDETDEPNG